MSHLATLINDLALILICAGIMTLLFKKLKQPLVLVLIPCVESILPFRQRLNMNRDSLNGWNTSAVWEVSWAVGCIFLPMSVH